MVLNFDDARRIAASRMSAARARNGWPTPRSSARRWDYFSPAKQPSPPKQPSLSARRMDVFSAPKRPSPLEVPKQPSPSTSSSPQRPHQSPLERLPDDGGVLSPGLSTKKKSPQRLELEAELLFRAEEEYTQDYSPGAWGVHSWSDDDTAGPQIDPDNLLARERLKWAAEGASPHIDPDNLLARERLKWEAASASPHIDPDNLLARERLKWEAAGASPHIDPDNLLARERLKWESAWAGTDDADAGTQATWFGALCRCLGAPTSAQAKPRRRYDLDRYSA